MNQTKIEIMRHSTAHVLAAAVLELFPEAKFGIGPVIENGFYYDFDLPRQLVPADLPKIETKMRQIIKMNLPFEREEMSRDEAIALFQKLNQPYKLELLREGTIGEGGKMESLGEKVSIYKTGKFIDLCRGPHVARTKEIGIFHLTSIAGAYWRGDEKKPMLQRIYGVAFETQKELDDYLKMLKEAEARDHRKLGEELDLFHIDEEVGAGLPLWHPKGALLRQVIEDYWIVEHYKNGYELVRTPHIGHLKLWQTSGHWNFYRENMYSPIEIEGEKYLLKPMNCPFHIKIYKSRMRSYRDLPMRWAELGTVYRYERSGVLCGLVRVRGFTQDDAHIICRPDQFEKELELVLRFAKKMLGSFGFKNYKVYLSLRDPKDKKKYIGEDKVWDFAEKTLQKVLDKVKLKYQIDIGEAKFYGPAVDIKICDALGREWQCSTLQLDLNLPARFQMEFINQKGQKETPIMLHRTLLGSLERFVAVLLEHYAGALPVWLAPVQVDIIPVGKRHVKPSFKLAKILQEEGLRVHVDDLNETVGYKIRKAERQKAPYMLVLGDKEAKGKLLNIRIRGKKKIVTMSIKKFIDEVKKKIKQRK
jgi:threonyl-tRNA synthetase